MLDTTKLRAEYYEFLHHNEFILGLKVTKKDTADFFISKFELHQKSLLEEVEKEIGEKPTEEEIKEMSPYRQGMIDGTARMHDIFKALLTKNLEIKDMDYAHKDDPEINAPDDREINPTGEELDDPENRAVPTINDTLTNLEK